MSGETKAVIVAAGILLILILWWTGVGMLSSNPEPVAQKTTELKNLRFQKVETFVFQKTKYETHTAVIYEDTKTGVKYLYICKGTANGGPCITRLWEE